MAAASSTSPLPRPQGTSTSTTAIPTSLSKTPKKQVEKLPAQSLTASGSTTATKAAPPLTKKKKKKKRHSPFRIKVGCIVALRYRAGGNNLKRTSSGTIKSSSFTEVWTDPQPGRDDGLALIGRRVRCCFPKSVLSNEGASTRIVEGEVISLIDYPACWETQQEKRRKREPCFTPVELLVDRKALESLPFLERTEEDIDTSKMSSTEKKRQDFEDIIRGKNMVMVKVNLADASGLSVDKKTAKASKDLIAKWVIRKRVPVASKQGDNTVSTTNGHASESTSQNGSSEVSKPPRKKKKSSKDPGKSPTLYLGDKNDPQAEQERNWRWLAGRYDNMLLSSESGVGRPPEQLSCGLIGEVLSVEPTPSTANGKPHTLATVTLRRVLLPEHSVSGRLPHHSPVDIFDDADGSAVETNQNSKSLTTFQVPVEELVIISRKFQRNYDKNTSTNGASSGLSCPVVTRSYSYRSNSYRRLASDPSDATLNEHNHEETFDVCHRCRKTEKSGSMECMKSGLAGQDKGELTCHGCQEELKKTISTRASAACDCRACSLGNDSDSLFKVQVETAITDLEENGGLGDTNDVKESALTLARSVARKMRPADFDLPPSFMDFQSLPEASEKPITVTKSKRGRKTPKKSVKKASSVEKDTAGKKEEGQPDSVPGRPKSTTEHSTHKPPGSKEDHEEEQAFVPSCSRLAPYDPMRKHATASLKRQMGTAADGGLSNQSVPVADTGATIKQASRKRTREPERIVENKSTSRAARADQRRLKRGVAALGASSIGLDALAGREQQLRFDRSSIHAWGVFADEDINAGDMVVEYRGELIGNAMAEKREIEYEKAKIGSDYMFRIDGFMVCDATKQGNVARFINASCDPNCYTQIITLNGNKRIVIYAKRDIKAGEELCYDYKFAFEHDETKRIPCHCGAKDCRGFMNWDKRYVSLTANSNTGAAGQEKAS